VDPSIADQFVARYAGEVDYLYAVPGIPIDPSLVQIIEDVIAVGGAAFAAKLGANLGDAAFEALKEKVGSYLLDRKRGPPKVYRVIGSGVGRTVLSVGKLRPLFRIERGAVLLLANLTIEYEGSPRGLIYEERAPSFFPINVEFRRKK